MFLTLHLFVLISGDYWIYHLGPTINVNEIERFAYAIVGGPLKPSLGLDKTQLFVLARDPTTFKEKYDKDVLEWTDANGFNHWWNEPRPTGSIGKFQWFPYPRFTEGNNSHGEFGQSGCAACAGLEPPCDGSEDPRK